MLRALPAAPRDLGRCAAHAPFAVDLCFRGPLASCARRDACIASSVSPPLRPGLVRVSPLALPGAGQAEAFPVRHAPLGETGSFDPCLTRCLRPKVQAVPARDPKATCRCPSKVRRPLWGQRCTPFGRSLWVCDRRSRRGSSLDAWVRRPRHVGRLPRVPMLEPEGSADQLRSSSRGPCGSTRRSHREVLAKAPSAGARRPEGLRAAGCTRRLHAGGELDPKVSSPARQELDPLPVAGVVRRPRLLPGKSRWPRLVNGSVRRPGLPPGKSRWPRLVNGSVRRPRLPPGKNR